MKALALFRRRVVAALDVFVEVAMGRVPRPPAPSKHRFKYRLAYGVAGECVVRYDNELHKGDHRHVGALESPYPFPTPDQLMADFNADLVRWNHENGRP